MKDGNMFLPLHLLWATPWIQHYNIAKSSICCVCFLYENLSEYEGFRPWQGFIFVEIFVIEFLVKGEFSSSWNIYLIELSESFSKENIIYYVKKYLNKKILDICFKSLKILFQLKFYNKNFHKYKLFAKVETLHTNLNFHKENTPIKLKP